MANREACELYIEQEIKDQLAQGKKPWSIGKELSKWVEKMFETTINPRTIESRAYQVREKENTLNQVKKSQTAENTEYSKPEIIENRQPQGGGAREGAGRPKIEKISHANEIVLIAISQMDRIQDNDPLRDEALTKMIEYCYKRRATNYGKNT